MASTISTQSDPLADLARCVDGRLVEDRFLEQLLSSLVAAVDADGAALWKQLSRGNARLTHDRDMPRTFVSGEKARDHAQLVMRVLSAGQCGCVRMGEHSLVLAPVSPTDCAAFVVELVFDRELPSDDQLDILAVVARAEECTREYFRARYVRRLETERAAWQQLDHLREEVHRSLRTKTVAYAIANEGRRIIGCDRVSVAIKRGARWPLLAISGQDSFDVRSDAVRGLERLVTSTLRTGEPLWYVGNADSLPPQLRDTLDTYLTRANSKIIGILPLAVSHNDDEPSPDPQAALIVEVIEDSTSLAEIQDRADVVCRQSARALTNAQDHERLPLVGLWETVAKSRALVQARALPKTLAVAVAVVVITAILTFVPYDFDMHATGTLEPAVRRDVFATIDGTVDQVLVHHGDHVTQGQLLATLRNTDLDVSITDATGQLAASHEQLASVERSLFEDGKRLSIEERNRLAGERDECRQRMASLKSQLTLLQTKRTKLEVRSPIDGEVTTWNLDELLRDRPLKQGQILMSVADMAGPWELEIRVPEDRIGCVMAAQQQLGNALDVEYHLATDPETDLVGRVTDVHLAAEVHGDDGNTVLVRVNVDRDALPHRQLGADCRASIHCGRRALGYVLFRDVVAFVHSRILFRL